MKHTDSSTTLVILAAGRARRYGGCKPLAPIGPSGEPVIDLLASDALAAGFGSIVLVVSPATGPAIRYHVEHRWPPAVKVGFALQERPLGTVHAVLSAVPHLDPERPFAVGNADDLYGEEAFALLAAHLSGTGDGNALVAYELANAVVGSAPVTRGVLSVGAGGVLESVTERRQVVALPGGTYSVGDGREPSELEAGTLVSMNLWGFGPAMRATLEQAMAEALDASEEAEVLLPEVVGEVLERARLGKGEQIPPFQVLQTKDRCIGVTHPEDLALAQADIARQVGAGERPAQVFESVGSVGTG